MIWQTQIESNSRINIVGIQENKQWMLSTALVRQQKVPIIKP